MFFTPSHTEELIAVQRQPFRFAAQTMADFVLTSDCLISVGNLSLQLFGHLSLLEIGVQIALKPVPSSDLQLNGVLLV